VDVFAAGCVVFYMLTDGEHPFGSKFEREANIVSNRCDLTLVRHLPEAEHLIRGMLEHEPRKRMVILDALNHPFFWGAEKQLSFLQDVSDRVESEEAESPLVRYACLFMICSLQRS
jgi:serine/threonine-protein kinase/endoribonuclease IRE1